MGRPRREWGSGSVYPELRDGQPTGRFIARIEISDGAGRRRFRRARCPDRKAAERQVKAWTKELEAGTDLNRSRRSLKAWLEGWLSDLAARGKVAARTLEFYGRHAEYAIPHMGHRPIEAVKPEHWRTTQAALLAAGLSRRSVNHVHSVLRNALNLAVRERVIAVNPMTLVDPLPLGDDEFEARPLSPREIDAFEAALVGERLELFFRFILDHGVRNDEARSLRWTDVLLDAVDEDGAPDPHFMVRRGKSRAAKRRMPLTAAWAVLLRQQWERLAEERALAERKAARLAHEQGKDAGPRTLWREHGYVFPSEVGTKLGEGNVNKVKQRILQRAGLCDPCPECQQTGTIGSGKAATRCEACLGRGVQLWPIRIHDLRATAVTDWVAEVGDPKTAQKLAGHSDPGVTMKVYAKGRMEKERAALERVEERRRKRREKVGGS